jgi:hypothetical protein
MCASSYLSGLHQVAKLDAGRRIEWEKKNNPQAIAEDEEVGEIEERGSEFKFKPSPNSSSRVWVFGTCVFVSGSLLNFASVSVGPYPLFYNPNYILTTNSLPPLP